MATQENNRRRLGGFVCAIWVLISVLLTMDAGKTGIGPFDCHRDLVRFKSDPLAAFSFRAQRGSDSKIA